MTTVNVLLIFDQPLFILEILRKWKMRIACLHEITNNDIAWHTTWYTRLANQWITFDV